MNSKILAGTRWLINAVIGLHLNALRASNRASAARVATFAKFRDAAEYAAREAAEWASEARADYADEARRDRLHKIATKAEAQSLRKGAMV